MRTPALLAAALLAALALVGLGQGAPAIEQPGVPLSAPGTSALPLASPSPASPVWPAVEPADVPELTGSMVIVGRAAGLVGSQARDLRVLTAGDLEQLAAEQQLHAALQGLGRSRWMLQRLGDVPSIPAASVLDRAPVEVGIPPAARAAFAALATAGILSFALPKLPLLPLYSRIEREEAMLNSRRAQLYELVRAEPGIHLSDLVRRSGLGWGAALYHLGVLEKGRIVVAHPEGGFKRYFANGVHHREEMTRLTALRHDAAKALFEAVHAMPGRSGRELAQALSLSPSTLARASERLEGAGLVRRVRAGRRMLYFPGEPVAPERPAASLAAA